MSGLFEPSGFTIPPNTIGFGLPESSRVTPADIVDEVRNHCGDCLFRETTGRCEGPGPNSGTHCLDGALACKYFDDRNK